MGRDSHLFGDPVAFSLPPLTRAVRTILLANGAVFLVEFVVSLISPKAEEGMVRLLGLVPSRVFSLPPWLWQFATSPFMHSPSSPFHLLINLLALYMLGGIVEERKGSAWFVRLYAVSALAGGFAHAIYGGLYFPEVPCIGASGAVLGVVLAAARLYPRLPVLFWFVLLPLWVVASILVALDAYPILREIRYGVQTGVSHAAHLGGALAGFLWAGAPEAVTSWRVPTAPAFLRARLSRWRNGKAEARGRRMDAILARINERGIGSLTASEKRFLRRESRRARERKGGKG